MTGVRRCTPRSTRLLAYQLTRLLAHSLTSSLPHLLYLNVKVHAALDSLPFVKDTLRLRQRDTQLVQQLADLEQARS